MSCRIIGLLLFTSYACYSLAGAADTDSIKSIALREGYDGTLLIARILAVGFMCLLLALWDLK